MNRFKEIFNRDEKLLSVYVTAGFPNLNDTVKTIEHLEKSGVAMVEIGMPFSDPLADGEVIQQSSQQALENGMSLNVLFEQLQDIRKRVSIPLVLMGYINPVLQYGVEAFCKKCQTIGVDGVILPDLPIEFYEANYKATFEKYNLSYVGLITPQTYDERIRIIEKASTGFLYMVSSASTTGNTTGFNEEHSVYFERIANLNLSLPLMVGFGIKDKASFNAATEFTNGAIVGSAFIKHVAEKGVEEKSINEFTEQIKG